MRIPSRHSIGFLPVGSYIGESLGSTEYRWLLIPVGMLLGYFIVLAEPAVHVLEKQVEEVTSGTISKKSPPAARAISSPTRFVTPLAEKQATRILSAIL